METTEAFQDLLTGSQIEMVCVCKDYLIADVPDPVMIYAFDSTVCSDRHEGRCLDPAMRQIDITKTRTRLDIPECACVDSVSHVSFR